MSRIGHRNHFRPVADIREYLGVVDTGLLESGLVADASVAETGIENQAVLFTSPTLPVGPGTTCKSWKSALVGSNPVSKAGDIHKLHFVAPCLEDSECRAFVPEDLFTKANQKWVNSIVLKVVGTRPYHIHFSAYIRRVWNPVGQFELFARKNGYYFVTFEKEEDYLRILIGGPYFFDSRLILLQKWKPGIKFTKELLCSIPIWVRLYLEIELWDADIISVIASVLGTPIELDCRSASNLGLARVLVEMQAAASFPHVIKVDLFNGVSMEIPVVYEYIPPRCGVYKAFVHLQSNCKVIAMEVWRPKNFEVGAEAAGAIAVSIDRSEVSVSAGVNLVKGAETPGAAAVSTVRTDVGVAAGSCEGKLPIGLDVLSTSLVVESVASSVVEGVVDVVMPPHVDACVEEQVTTVNLDGSEVLASSELPLAPRKWVEDGLGELTKSEVAELVEEALDLKYGLQRRNMSRVKMESKRRDRALIWKILDEEFGIFSIQVFTGPKGNKSEGCTVDRLDPDHFVIRLV